MWIQIWAMVLAMVISYPAKLYSLQIWAMFALRFETNLISFAKKDKFDYSISL
jgi:hypothetical protein